VNVAFVISSMRIGGAQKVLAHLANHMQGLGHQVQVITQAPVSTDRFALSHGVRRRCFGREGDSSNFLDALVSNWMRVRSLRAVVKSENPDLLVSFLGETNILAILASRFLSTKIVINERSNLAKEPVTWFWRCLRPLTYRLADRVITNSNGTFQILSLHVPSAKLKLLKNPLTVQKYQTPKKGESDDVVRILTVCRLSKEKGVDLLLKSVRMIREYSDRKFNLKIVGDGPCREEWEKLASDLEVSDLVKWCGSSSDVEKYYMEADIFVLASRYEGMPNVLLEAMSCGIPVVVTDASEAIRELIGDNENGLIVPTEAPRALAEAVGLLIDNRGKRAGFSKKARRTIDQLGQEKILGSWVSTLTFDQENV
jgi:GalNAc-alpha-(1->4)-GalNAc-alpha-(1->3)-diNAcBac-PP-undecaprenol alpha-1,4-N-acetyl-D-galactosaminyltransferase